MRSEDRKPSKRVFPLLQNLDLDSVTFAQIQSTGNPISIEDMNEQEMVDLIIVNLARLCTVSEWDGLLEAGSATFNAVLPVDPISYDGYRYTISMAPPYGGLGVPTGTELAADFDDPMAYPFISPKSGDVSEIGIKVSTSSTDGDCLVGIYSDVNGVCTTRLGFVTIDVGSTGNIYQTSISSGPITLVAGTQYWFAVGFDATMSTGALQCITEANMVGIGLAYAPDSIKTAMEADEPLTALPVTFPGDYTVTFGRPLVSLKIG
jgi:hypothetical protein